jgi:hypothetical protein
MEHTKLVELQYTVDIVDVSYAAPEAYEIVNVALHREYSLSIVFIFSKGGRISIMSKTNTESNSNCMFLTLHALIGRCPF